MSQTMWTVATILAVLGLVLFGLILKKLMKAYKEIDPKYQPLQLQFKYTSSDVKPEPIDRRFSLLFIPMLFYAGLALAVVAHNAANHIWMRYAMYSLTAAGCFAGFAETLLLAFGRGKAAPVCGLIKWGCFGVWTLGMFIGLFLKGWAL